MTDQFIVRMPPELCSALQERAVENHRSMNGQAIYEIEAALRPAIGDRLEFALKVFGEQFPQDPSPPSLLAERIGHKSAEKIEAALSKIGGDLVQDNLDRIADCLAVQADWLTIVEGVPFGKEFAKRITGKRSRSRTIKKEAAQ